MSSGFDFSASFSSFFHIDFILEFLPVFSGSSGSYHPWWLKSNHSTSPCGQENQSFSLAVPKSHASSGVRGRRDRLPHSAQTLNGRGISSKLNQSSATRAQFKGCQEAQNNECLLKEDFIANRKSFLGHHELLSLHFLKKLVSFTCTENLMYNDLGRTPGVLSCFTHVQLFATHGL